MGLLTRGPINVSVLRVETGPIGVAQLSKAAAGYRTQDDPSSGWGSFKDEPVHAQRESLQYPFSTTAPAPTINHNDTSVLRMRYYFEKPNPALRRAFGDISDRRRYSERLGVDLIFLDADEEATTVLVSTTNDAELKGEVKPAIEQLVATARGDESGLVTDYANLDNFDPDIFLWLLYKEAHQSQLSPTIKLGGVSRMNSRSGTIWRSQFLQGATIDRADILALIAKGNTIFGPAKFSFTHSGTPKGWFEITLSEDLSFSVLRTSYYQEDDLDSLPEEEIGPRMVEDAWQILIPAIRDAFRNDTSWHARDRAAFIAKCRDAVHMI